MEWEWGLGAWSHFGHSPLHFSRFRFVRSRQLRAGQMGPVPLRPVPKEAQAQGATRHSNLGFEDGRGAQPGQALVGPALGSPNLWSLRECSWPEERRNLMTWPHGAYL